MVTLDDEFHNMLRASRDPISAYFDERHAFIDRRPIRAPDRPIALARRAKTFSIASLRGHSIWPPPVAVAEFAAGEKIRMSFWQHANKPWNFIAARRLLAQTIGNERGLRAHDEYEKIAAGIKQRKRNSPRKVAINLHRINIYPPAADFVAFHIEHDGKRYDEQTATVSSGRPKLKIRAIEPSSMVEASKQTEPRGLGELMTEMETHLGSDFLDTKAWRRVRSRVKALARIAA